MATDPVRLEAATAADADDLATLRARAMRESLETLGRFDPERARRRLLDDYSPEHTRHIITLGQRVGFLVVRPSEEWLLLDHLYVAPEAQGRGVGSAALRLVIAEAQAAKKLLRVGALKQSASNRFYVRHGFELVGESEWDNYYLRR